MSGGGRHVRRRPSGRRRTLLRVLIGLTSASLLVNGTISLSAAAGTLGGASYSDYEYTQSDDVLANPGRGLTHTTITHWGADGSDWTPLDESTLRTWRTDEAVTLDTRFVYLDDLVDSDTLPADLLDKIAADFDTARAAGVKLIVRFAYSETTNVDAPPARAVAHIGQLAPVLNANADVIAVLQAGFVGQFGQWYDTTSYAQDPSTPWILSDADWDARGEVLDALLDATDPGIEVQVRTPQIARRLLADAGASTASRVGIHDDCFLSGTDDSGTFLEADDREWLADVSQTAVVGGNACEDNPPVSAWTSAAESLAQYHFTFLDKDWNPAVLDSWGSGYVEAENRLGYRLRLQDANLPTQAEKGAPVTASFTLVNDGYAAPVQNRPVDLVLTSAGGTQTVPLVVDLREVQPGAPVTVTATFAAPATVGSYSLSLSLPDSAASLADRPEYAIQLANEGTWDASTGYNDLGAELTVTTPRVVPAVPSTPSPTATRTPTEIPTATPTGTPATTPTNVPPTETPTQVETATTEIAAPPEVVAEVPTGTPTTVPPARTPAALPTRTPPTASRTTAASATTTTSSRQATARATSAVPSDSPTSTATGAVVSSGSSGSPPSAPSPASSAAALPSAPVPVATSQERGSSGIGHTVAAIGQAVTRAVDELLSTLPAPVALTVRNVADRSGFPTVLTVMVVLFLLLQNQLDRRDPKLVLSPLRAPERVVFDDQPTRWSERKRTVNHEERS